MLILVIVVLAILLAIATYAAFNTMLKVEKLEAHIDTIRDDITFVLDEMREIDTNGSFESDDEVGSIFEGLAEILLKLKQYGF